jgi:hypothetical protein
MFPEEEAVAGKAEKELRAALGILLPLLDEIEADDWGLDATRDLRAYGRATLADLENGCFRTLERADAIRRLGRLGAELQLQSWAELWRQIPEWAEPMTRAEQAARSLREALQD